jgi:hypothetical protein
VACAFPWFFYLATSDDDYSEQFLFIVTFQSPPVVSDSKYICFRVDKRCCCNPLVINLPFTAKVFASVRYIVTRLNLHEKLARKNPREAEHKKEWMARQKG